MPVIKLQDRIFLSDETYQQLQEITAFHNEWAAQQEGMKNLGPLTIVEFLLASMPPMIREEYAKMQKERAQQ